MLPRRGTPRLYDLVKLHSDTPSSYHITPRYGDVENVRSMCYRMPFLTYCVLNKIKNGGG